MSTAKDKLIVALDVDTATRAFELCDALGDSVGMCKVGVQLFTAAGPDVVRKIVSGGGRVFLDLKYHDIPNTVAMAGIEAARLGVSIFNVHAAGGSEMMKRTADAVAEISQRENLTRPKVIGVTVLTSVGQQTLRQSGIGEEPASIVSRLASLANESGLDGVVASGQEIKTIRETVLSPDFLIVTPGMRTVSAMSDDQRRTMSAGDAVRAGADYVVVGRPILAAPDPADAARHFVDEIAAALEGGPQPSDLAEQSRAQNVY
jgi:orotidine-5'-phosphate decarboxylase